MEGYSTKVLIVDDDASARKILQSRLRAMNVQVLVASGGSEALEQIRRETPSIVLLDLQMPKMSGIDVLRSLKREGLEATVIVVTAHATIETAVEAMKEGAYDFITKPFERAQIVRMIRQALAHRLLVLENRRLQRKLDELVGAGKIIGESPAIRQLLALVAQVAPSSATVLIQGESGTGKELLARALHEGSPRSGRPFIRVNCAALPETLLESELFGYERGAFTGATARKEGRFELADGGTLLFDEVGDLSPATQAKLLRVLQEGEFERLGGTKTSKVDVRVVAATNQDLALLVKEHRFREDLYYRLNGITIAIPPLRERPEDVPLLAQHFLRIYAAKNHRAVDGFSEEAMAQLRAYPWPGNVRELEHAVERAVILARESLIDLHDLPPALTEAEPSARVVSIPIGMPLDEVEQRLIEETLRLTKGNKELAAKLLGIASRTIYRKLKE